MVVVVVVVCKPRCVCGSSQAYALAFQSDGALLASGDLGGIGRVWDLRSGKSIMTIKVRL